MDILDKFFEMKKISEGTNKMILILVKPEYVEEMSNRFEMAEVSVNGVPGFIFSEADVRRLDREYNGDLIDLMFYAPEWKSVSDIRDYVDREELEQIHDWSCILEESKIMEGVGDLPAGYTDEDLAEFLDKEEKNPMPSFEEDDYYDPNDEIIQFVLEVGNSELQNKINNEFEAGYIEDSSMATIGEFRDFVMKNELDVEDFKIFDTKGEEYFDKLALVYDIAPDSQHTQESMAQFLDPVQKVKMTESIIAGANGLVYSNERRTAKHDAADKLLRKLGKLPENSEEFHRID